MIERSEKIKLFSQRLKDAKKANRYFYLREIQGPSLARIIVEGKEFINFASYSYLGLIEHPKIMKAAKDAIDKYGSGAGGVRLLAGTTTLHKKLEEKLAEFKKAEAAITFSSGYVTNLSTISCLTDPKDIILIDKLNHASIIDGCMLSGARFRTYKHNNMEHLEKILEKSKDYNTKLIVADAVFSMDGDIADLPNIRKLADKYGADVMIDEAHSLGVLGKTGRGIEQHFNMEGSVDISMGTLSKTIPSIGGYIASNKDVIDYLKHISRGFVFSASLPPSAVAATLAALEVMEKETWRYEKLRENIRLFIQGLIEMGFNTMNSETAVVPVLIGDEERTLELARFLNDNGIYVCPILYPAIPKNTNRVRNHLMATHSIEDINKALDIYYKGGKKIGIK
ncbi:MAG: aminotransferase class I/II-fold pyridoxal phosphate-dependent enzyme [Actinobacteria bacterium]|nr:aminotransferase class I/II-fold pyridoxal phosphate-dependent enzyme [Actinomycetota bacterium]